jgi:hypothetical protein
VFGGLGVGLVIPPALGCIVDCRDYPPWAAAFAIAGATLFAAGVSMFVVAAVDDKAGTYERAYEVVDRGKAYPCPEMATTVP